MAFHTAFPAAFAILVVSAPSFAQSQGGLFAGSPASVPPGPHGLSAIEGNLDTRALALGRRNLHLDLPDGSRVQLRMDAIDRRGAGDLGWHGHATGYDESSVVLTLKHGLVFGRLSVGAKVFEVRSRHIGRGRLVVEEIDTDSLPACSVGPEFGVDGAGASPVPAAADGGGGAGAASDVTIDLLSVYSNDALAALGSVASIEAFTQAAVDSANASFFNSDMTARYRLVHVAAVDHDTLGSTGADLSWVANESEVADLRDEFGADMVSILVDTPSSCGTAYVQKSPGPGFASLAFQVSDVDCAVGGLTFAHEHGHNLGMEHNYENSGSPGTASYPWSFGQWVDTSFRTVMSYSEPCTGCCSRTTKFSNPDVFHNGVPTGFDGSRDNARTGDSTGPIAAAFRSTVVPSGNGNVAVVTSLIVTGDDDVEERQSDGAMILNSSDIELGADGSTAQVVGLRFQSLDIPQGATILSAELLFTVDEVDSGTTDVVIRAQAADDAPAFTATAFDVSGRSLTSNSAAWSVPEWSAIGLNHASPDQRRGTGSRRSGRVEPGQQHGLRDQRHG